MSTEITRHQAPNTALAIQDNQTEFNEQQVATLRQLGVATANRGDLAVFFHQAVRTGLDPFARQIYMIERQGKQTIQTGIDGFRLIARRTVERTGESLGYEDTLWCGPEGQWTDVWLKREAPAASKVTVIRGGQRFSAVALYQEYVATKRDGSPNQMWSTKGALMLAKCAEALALRKAFPQDLSGLYTSDEMQQADNPAPRAQAQPSQGGSRLAQAMGQRPQPQQQPVESQPEPWQAQWAELKDALAAAGLAPAEDRGDLWLAKLTELTGAEWTHPNQISPEAAAEVFQMLATPTADEATGEIVDEPTP